MVERNKTFQIVTHCIMILLCLMCVLPFVLLIMSSLADEEWLIMNGYSFLPAKLSLDAYRYLLIDSTSIVRGYMISIFVTVLGTCISLVMTTLMAYPLSRKDLPGRYFFSFFIFFTMLFNGGLVPSYIMWTRMFHIKNTIFALLIPNLLMGAFYVIMMRTYFSSNIPDAVIEAARIDGAGEMRILLKIVLPMSLPIIATLALLTGLGYWNDWLNGLYYVQNDKLYSIQVLLNPNADGCAVPDEQHQHGGCWASANGTATLHGNQDGSSRAGRIACTHHLSILSKVFCKGHRHRCS